MRRRKSHATIHNEKMLRHPECFSYWGAHVTLRPYQQAAIQAVVNSVRNSRGRSFVWIFPRQSGKDEALALMVAYLLAFCSRAGGEIVFLNPTFTPQTETSMRRLETRLRTNSLTRGKWERKGGYIYQIGRAFCTYLSAEPSTNIVGATANRLLVVNEAQDISPFKFDKEVEPMVASTNATRLFSGTRWTGNTLLEREYQQARAEQAGDGKQRVFFYTAEDVRRCVPAYGASVDRAIARMGRQHPLVKTQYFCETVEAEVGMFPPGRQQLMQGSHAPLGAPQAGQTYAFLIDVAGQDEENQGLGGKGARDEGLGEMRERRRDSTALKIVEIDRSSLAQLGKPTYLAVLRKEWCGEKLVRVFGALQALVQVWKPARIVIDATGVGEGLWSLLENACGAKVVLPVKFTPQLKSDLGYGFISMIESGRYREYAPFPERLQRQLEYCRSEIMPGPAKLMRWGVPDGTRDRAGGELVHDDDLMTSALCVMLDGLEWYTPLPAVWTTPKDPLRGADRRF